MFLGNASPEMKDHFKKTQDQAKAVFATHQVDEDGAKMLQIVRDNYTELAALMLACTPPSRGQSLALTHLEDSLMWANKAITSKYPVANQPKIEVARSMPPPDSL